MGLSYLVMENQVFRGHGLDPETDLVRRKTKGFRSVGPGPQFGLVVG